MTEHEELLAEMEDYKKKQESSKKEVEELKKKIKPLAASFKRGSEAAASWLEDIDNNTRALHGSMAELQSSKKVSEELLTLLDELEDAQKAVKSYGEDIESLEDELKWAKKSFSDIIKNIAHSLKNKGGSNEKLSG